MFNLLKSNLKKIITLESCLVFLLVITYFKGPIFAVLGCKKLSKTLFLFPLYFSLICLFFKKYEFLILRKDRFLLIGGIVAYILFVLIVDICSTSQNYNSPQEFISNIYFFIFFPFILMICQIDFKTLDGVIFKTSLTVIFLGSIYLIIEYYLLKFHVVSISGIVEWLYSLEKLPNHDATNVGFLKKSSTSASTIGALYLFLLARFTISKKINSRFSLIVGGISVFLVNWGVHISYSVTSSVMVLFLSCFIFLEWAISEKKYLQALTFFSIQIIVFLNCSVSGKFVRYFIRNPLATIEDYKPAITGCKSSLFLTGVSISSVCTMDEFHYFGTTLRIGLLADLPRLLITFAPLYLFRNFRTIRQYPDYAALFASFLFTLLHYGDLEVWPNIFIYIMALYVVSYKLLKAEQINATNLT